MPHPAILSLAPDSLASLGELNRDSLSELWAVFTKCKDNLHNGRRLENLSWRLWFDSSRRESREDSSASVTGAAAGCDRADWSDPEAGNDTDWTESSATDVDDDDSDDDRRTSRLASSLPRPCPPPHLAPAPAPAPAQSPPSASRPSNRRRSSAQQHDATTATTGRPPMLRPEWRSSSTISGGSIQRIISAQPPISVPFKSHSVVEVTPIPLISPDAAGVTSRHSSAPDQFEPALVTTHSQLTALEQQHPPRKLVDARTQTTPSSSHRPSPKLPSSSLLASPPSQEIQGDAETSQGTSAPSIKLVKSPASYTHKGHARKQSAPRPPPPTPATSVRETQIRTPIASTSSLSSQQQLVPQSSVKGFDTTVFENRPLQGSIAPPPTPATALVQLAPSPPKRAPSALKGAPTSNGATRTSAANGRTANGGTGKKIFFISSPTSDSEDDGTSSCKSTRSRSSDWQSAVQTQGKRSSLSESVKADDLRQQDERRRQQDRDDDDEWDEADDDVSSEWSSEESDDGRQDRRGASSKQAEQAVFAKRPSSSALSGQPGELKRRPPGLLSQLFHPDLFLDDADRRHSLIDVRRANGAPPSESLSGLSATQSEANSPAARRSRLQTSKSTSVLGDPTMRHVSRSRSFLKGRPENVELESSSDDSDYEDVESSQDAEMLRRQHQQAHLAERLRLEQLAAQPIAPPQTPRSTRRAMLATELSESLRRNLLWERQQRNRVLGGPVNKFRLQPQPQQSDGTVSRQNTAPPAPEQATVQQQQQQQQNNNKASTTTKVDSTSALGTSVKNDVDVGGEMVRRHTTGAGLYLEGLAGESTRQGAAAASKAVSPEQQQQQQPHRPRGGSHGHPSAFAFRGLTSMTQAMVSPPRQPVVKTLNGDDYDEDESDTSSSDDEIDDKGKRDQPLTRRKSTFSSIWGQKVW
ncbi:hypothetical protein ACM66B_001374 [Microbotryomycetes sp. NB124-2]